MVWWIALVSLIILVIGYSLFLLDFALSGAVHRYIVLPKIKTIIIEEEIEDTESADRPKGPKGLKELNEPKKAEQPAVAVEPAPAKTVKKPAQKVVVEELKDKSQPRISMGLRIVALVTSRSLDRSRQRLAKSHRYPKIIRSSRRSPQVRPLSRRKSRRNRIKTLPTSHRLRLVRRQKRAKKHQCQRQLQLSLRKRLLASHLKMTRQRLNSHANVTLTC